MNVPIQGMYTYERFHIVENRMVGYANDTTVYAVIPRQLSRPQVMELPNLDLVAVHFWGLKWHIKLNPKKTKSTVISRS